jgi:hypothetical protein
VLPSHTHSLCCFHLPLANAQDQLAAANAELALAISAANSMLLRLQHQAGPVSGLQAGADKVKRSGSPARRSASTPGCASAASDLPVAPGMLSDVMQQLAMALQALKAGSSGAAMPTGMDVKSAACGGLLYERSDLRFRWEPVMHGPGCGERRSGERIMGGSRRLPFYQRMLAGTPRARTSRSLSASHHFLYGNAQDSTQRELPRRTPRAAATAPPPGSSPGRRWERGKQRRAVPRAALMGSAAHRSRPRPLPPGAWAQTRAPWMSFVGFRRTIAHCCSSGMTSASGAATWRASWNAAGSS